MTMWGKTIQTSGERPTWLGDEEFMITGKSGHAYGPYKTDPAFGDINWDQATHIQLVLNHPYYLATEAGFEYWPGGDTAPDDWDGGEVMYRGDPAGYVTVKPATISDDKNMNGMRWTHHPSTQKISHAFDIIGYRKRTTDDTVCMTEAEVRKIIGGFDAANRMIAALTSRGIIREPTEAERIAATTGLTVAQVQSVIDAQSKR